MKNNYNFSNVTINTKENINGDVYINNYFDNISKKEFSRQEQELVDLIYQHTSSDCERDELLNMLKAYRSSSEAEKETVKSKFNKKLIELAEKTGIATFAKFASEYLGNIEISNLKDFVEVS